MLARTAKGALGLARRNLPVLQGQTRGLLVRKGRRAPDESSRALVKAGDAWVAVKDKETGAQACASVSFATSLTCARHARYVVLVERAHGPDHRRWCSSAYRCVLPSSSTRLALSQSPTTGEVAEQQQQQLPPRTAASAARTVVELVAWGAGVTFAFAAARAVFG